MADGWTYPVLWINALGGIWVTRDDDHMFLGDKRSVASEALLSGQFFDVSLHQWKVTGARFLHYRPFLSKWREYPFQRVGTIALETEALGARLLTEIHECICATVDRDTEFWESRSSIRDLKGSIRSTLSFQDLIALFN